jgi:hypothetical protein
MHQKIIPKTFSPEKSPEKNRFWSNFFRCTFSEIVLLDFEISIKFWIFSTSLTILRENNRSWNLLYFFYTKIRYRKKKAENEKKLNLVFWYPNPSPKFMRERIAFLKIRSKSLYPSISKHMVKNHYTQLHTAISSGTCSFSNHSSKTHVAVLAKDFY